MPWGWMGLASAGMVILLIEICGIKWALEDKGSRFQLIFMVLFSLFADFGLLCAVMAVMSQIVKK
jgi:hypothetical protein